MAENNHDLCSGGAGGGAAFVSTAAAETNEALAAGMRDDWRQIAAAQARFIVRLAESNKREMFREDGATSPEAWVAECFGASVPTARSLSFVAEKAPELPHLVESLRHGDISFDKVRAVVDVATPRPTESSATKPKNAASASWSRSPGTPLPWPDPLLLPLHVPSTTAATCASTTGTAPCRSRCPPRSTPGPRLVSTSWAAALPSDERDALGPAPL